MDDYIWSEVVKGVAPGIGKIKARDVAYVFIILFSIYLNLHLSPSKLSADDT